jgi:hypothetical protein
MSTSRGCLPNRYRGLIVTLAARYKLPAVYPERHFVAGPDSEHFRIIQGLDTGFDGTMMACRPAMLGNTCRAVDSIVEISAATCQSRYVLRAFEEQILQHHSIVMRLVMRGEHQRDPSALRKRT